MHRAPPASLKMAGTSWRLSSLTPFLCSDLETKMKERLCLNNCRNIVPLPPQNKKKSGETALINTDSQGAGMGRRALLIHINQNGIRVSLTGPFYFPLT